MQLLLWRSHCCKRCGGSGHCGRRVLEEEAALVAGRLQYIRHPEIRSLVGPLLRKAFEQVRCLCSLELFQHNLYHGTFCFDVGTLGKVAMGPKSKMQEQLSIPKGTATVINSDMQFSDVQGFWVTL